MAAKPENSFIHGVHRYVTDVYFEKMWNPYRSGTADVWYDGGSKDIWIEYKYLSTIPKKSNIVLNLSDRQLMWLRCRYKNGRNVFVVCGCTQGGVVFTDLEWESPVSPDEFCSRILSRKELAAWIRDQTGPSYELSKAGVHGCQAD